MKLKTSAEKAIEAFKKNPDSWAKGFGFKENTFCILTMMANIAKVKCTAIVLTFQRATNINPTEIMLMNEAANSSEEICEYFLEDVIPYIDPNIEIVKL